MAKKIKEKVEIKEPEKVKVKKIVKAKNPDGRANLDMELLKETQSKMFELQPLNRDALIARIRKAEKW